MDVYLIHSWRQCKMSVSHHCNVVFKAFVFGSFLGTFFDWKHSAQAEQWAKDIFWGWRGVLCAWFGSHTHHYLPFAEFHWKCSTRVFGIYLAAFATPQRGQSLKALRQHMRWNSWRTLTHTHTLTLTHTTLNTLPEALLPGGRFDYTHNVVFTDSPPPTCFLPLLFEMAHMSKSNCSMYSMCMQQTLDQHRLCTCSMDMRGIDLHVHGSWICFFLNLNFSAFQFLLPELMLFSCSVLSAFVKKEKSFNSPDLAFFYVLLNPLWPV